MYINYQKKGLKIASIWFAENRIKDIEHDCDILYYHQSKEKFGQNYKQITTLHTNLSLSTECIMSKIDKKVAYEIRRSEREGVETKLYNSIDLSNDNQELKRFINLYNQFLKTKKMPGRCNLNAVKRYIEKGLFYLSTAIYDGKNVVYHAYICDNEIVRLLYSASLFREVNTGELRAIIGRANRHLHWEDIVMFKSLGFYVYDWGGLSNREEVNNIAKFKEGFGGEKIILYNSLIPGSLLGKAIIKLMDIKRILYRKTKVEK